MRYGIAGLMLLSAVLALSGCESVGDRIKENPALFAGLDAETQAKIKEGIIDLGFTKDMVYLALGEPNRKRQSKTEDGVREAWIYNTYYERYDGQRFVGYHRNVYYDDRVKTYRVFYTPVYHDTYRPQTEERIRIVFEDGKAISVEQSTGD